MDAHTYVFVLILWGYLLKSSKNTWDSSELFAVMQTAYLLDVYKYVSIACNFDVTKRKSTHSKKKYAHKAEDWKLE